jgi:hypothetical protein
MMRARSGQGPGVECGRVDPEKQTPRQRPVSALTPHERSDLELL